jgi:hypothetical protein
MTPSPSKVVDLKSILPIIAKDFAAIKKDFMVLAKLRKQESTARSATATKERQESYKARFKPTIAKLDKGSKTAFGYSGNMFSGLGSMAGSLGMLTAIIGTAGLYKLLVGANSGNYLKSFVQNILTSIVDIVQKAFAIVKNIFSNSTVQQSFFKTVNSIFEFITTGLLAAFSIFKNLITDSEVISKILEVIKNVFSAIYESIGSLASIIGNIFKENFSAIKDGLTQFLKKIFEVLIPLISIIIGSAKELVNNEAFRAAFKNIFLNLFKLVKAIWDISYVDQRDGTRKSVAAELLKWAGGLVLFYGAVLAAKAIALRAGAALAAANFSSSSPLDCGDLPDRDKKKGGRYKDAGRKMPESPKAKEKTLLEKAGEKYEQGKKYVGEKVTKARNAVAAVADKFKNKTKELIDAVKKPIVAFVKSPKLRAKAGAMAAKKFGEDIIQRIMSKLAVAGISATTGVGLIFSAINTALALYDLYELYTFMFVDAGSDPEKEDGGFYKLAKGEIDQYYAEAEKEGQKPTKTSATPSATPASTATTPSPAPVAAASTPSTTPTVAPAAAASTAPTPAPAAPAMATADASSGTTVTGYSTTATDALKSKMKVGDVSAKQHEPGTDVLAQNLMNLVPGFNKFTAFDDAFHNKVSPGSKHASGLALDFTINGGSEAYQKAAAVVRTHLSALGIGTSEAKVIDEMNNPSSKATGPHVHVQFQSKEAAEKYRANFPNTALSSFAKQAKDFLLDVEQGVGRGMSATAKAIENALPSLDNVKKVGGDLLEMAAGGLISGLKFVDGLTGGKLGLGSNEMNSALRMLEDEAKKGGGFFDLSSTVVSNKVENKTVAPVNPRVEDSRTLDAVLSRHYT